jgi:Ca-activated chloride channel family protein
MSKKYPLSKPGIHFFHDLSGQKLKSLFDRLLSLFKELLLASSGDVNYTFSWMNELDRRYSIFSDSYRLPEFIEDMKKNNLIDIQENLVDSFKPSSKLELELRKNAFESLFGKLRKSKAGKHKTKFIGSGLDPAEDLRPYEFGDLFQQMNTMESVKNAFVNHGIDQFKLEENDLISFDTIQQTQCSTVLMIDISHSMILYGEDRITPAKKVAMALSHMIRTYYPKDKLDIVVFGDDAWQVELSDLPYLEVGPYHTNTVAGLNLAIELLNKRKNPNKHIMMITDGKPTCIKRGKEYYKNSFGLDRFIVSRTLALARKCRKQKIDVTTFMVTSDPYLVEFVEQFSREANGKALYTNLEGLGEHMLINYENNKKKKSGK